LLAGLGKYFSSRVGADLNIVDEDLPVWVATDGLSEVDLIVLPLLDELGEVLVVAVEAIFKLHD
jgi:hypothetical protein